MTTLMSGSQLSPHPENEEPLEGEEKSPVFNAVELLSSVGEILDVEKVFGNQEALGVSKGDSVDALHGENNFVVDNSNNENYGGEPARNEELENNEGEKFDF
ncbi:hypothetical protein Hanom_Chr12g01106761 [Helianthus anomalus]